MTKAKISQSVDIHNLETVILQVCWVLDFLDMEKGDRFKIKEITEFLIEEKGIPTSYQAVTAALKAKANKRFTNLNHQGYKLMKPGRDELEKEKGSNSVLLIEPGKPFTNKKESSKAVFQKLSGDIKICDPYCGPGILDLICDSFKKSQNILILTSQIIDRPSGSFARAFKDLRSEGFNIEIRIYKSSDLHDRYILADNSSWLSGYGFNDIGKKESFLVMLGDDISQILDATYRGRWKKSTIYLK